MRLTLDPRYNVAYIHLRAKRRKVRTVRVSDELNVDLAADGTIYGIELLNANEQPDPATRSLSRGGRWRRV